MASVHRQSTLNLKNNLSFKEHPCTNNQSQNNPRFKGHTEITNQQSTQKNNLYLIGRPCPDNKQSTQKQPLLNRTPMPQQPTINLKTTSASKDTREPTIHIKTILASKDIHKSPTNNRPKKNHYLGHPCTNDQ